MIRTVANIADSTLQIPSACIMARPSTNQDHTTALVHILKVQLTDVAMDEWNDPELAID